MDILPILITVACCILMMFIGRQKRIELLLAAYLCLSACSIPGFSFNSCPSLLALLFLLRECKNIRRSIKQFRHTFILTATTVVVIGGIIQIITSIHLHNFSSLIGYILGDFFCKYFVLAALFIAITDKRQVKALLKTTETCLIILIGFALFEFVTHVNIIMILFGKDPTFIISEGGVRQRVSSLFISSFDFGYTCLLLLIYLIYAYNSNWLPKQRFYILTVLCFIGIVLCGCRTVLACTLVTLAAYSLIRYRLSKNVFIFVSCTTTLIIGYLYVPWIQEKCDFLLSAFDPDSNVEGSSLTMRQYQYLAVAHYVKNNIWFGRGYRFFLIDMGWGKDSFNSLQDMDLMGLEGVLMNRLLEAGIIGVLVYLLFWGLLLYVSLRKLKEAPLESSICVSFICACVMFGNMTGELNSIARTLFFLGMFLKLKMIRIKSVHHKR